VFNLGWNLKRLSVYCHCTLSLGMLKVAAGAGCADEVLDGQGSKTGMDGCRRVQRLWVSTA
jgi:hypothetical protein